MTLLQHGSALLCSSSWCIVFRLPKLAKIHRPIKTHAHLSCVNNEKPISSFVSWWNYTLTLPHSCFSTLSFRSRIFRPMANLCALSSPSVSFLCREISLTIVSPSEPLSPTSARTILRKSSRALCRSRHLFWIWSSQKSTGGSLTSSTFL